jgi:hypothetical protein
VQTPARLLRQFTAHEKGNEPAEPDHSEQDGSRPEKNSAIVGWEAAFHEIVRASKQLERHLHG